MDETKNLKFLTFALKNNQEKAMPFETMKIPNSEVLHQNLPALAANTMDLRWANLTEVNSNQLKHLIYKKMLKLEVVSEPIQMTLAAGLQLD